MKKRNVKESPLTGNGPGKNHTDMTSGTPSRHAVRIEFPGEGDVISGPSYTIHIESTPGSNLVEVSIDQGEWMSCRESLGLWWYDWNGFEAGDHELTARARIGESLSTESQKREFSVA